MKYICFLFSLVTVLITPAAFSVDFDKEALISAHNKWRAEVGIVEKLGYSNELAESALAWAKKLKHDNQCKMRHSDPQGKYGENLYWGSAINWSDGRKELQKISPIKVVDSWGSEKADYDYGKNGCKAGKMCGHYTQLVWRDTLKVGCAVEVCEDTQQQIWVCQYQPAGNWVGEKPY